MEKLEGMISDIVFKNEENGYTIAYLSKRRRRSYNCRMYADFVCW